MGSFSSGSKSAAASTNYPVVTAPMLPADATVGSIWLGCAQI